MSSWVIFIDFNVDVGSVFTGFGWSFLEKDESSSEEDGLPIGIEHFHVWPFFFPRVKGE